MTSDSLYVHTLNPFAIRFTETFGIRWYGLAYLTGFFAAYQIILCLAKRDLILLKAAQAGDFIFAGALGTIIGGRLGYCLLYSPDLFTNFSSHFPFWGVLAINQGGMASHGGILGILIACIVWGKKHNIDPLHLADLTTLGGPIGIFFGRIANFVNGELVGRPCETLHAWCVKFPQDILLWPGKEPQHLSQIAPLASNFGISQSEWNNLITRSSYEPGAWESMRELLEKILGSVQAGNQETISKLAPYLEARHPSQLYEAGLEGLLLFLIMFLAWKKPRKPGVICGIFFCAYSAVRILGEQFRMPDAQIGYQLWGLTRGQWLSFGLLAFGIAVIFAVSSRKTNLVGGWGKN